MGLLSGLLKVLYRSNNFALNIGLCRYSALSLLWWRTHVARKIIIVSWKDEKYVYEGMLYRGGWVICTLRLEVKTYIDVMLVIITSDGRYSWVTCGCLEKCINISTIIDVSLYWEEQRLFLLCVIRNNFFPYIFPFLNIFFFFYAHMFDLNFCWWQKGDEFMGVFKMFKTIYWMLLSYVNPNHVDISFIWIIFYQNKLYRT